MKNPFFATTIILFTLMLLLTSYAQAKESEVILIEAEIYQREKPEKMAEVDDILSGAILVESPTLLINVGTDATIEIGSQNKQGKDENMLRLYLKSDIQGKNYDVSFQLNSKGDERISRVESIKLGGTLILSSSLNNIFKIAKIKTRKFASFELAMAAKDKK
jgi:hypothetical protein